MARARQALEDPAFSSPRIIHQSEVDRKQLKVHVLPANHGVHPDGNLVTWSLKFKFMRDFRFEYCIDDEGHIARRTSSVWNQTIGLVPADKIV
jgi:hypothetical protein